jgi:hypothetical protein
MSHNNGSAKDGDKHIDSSDIPVQSVGELFPPSLDVEVDRSSCDRDVQVVKGPSISQGLQELGLGPLPRLGFLQVRTREGEASRKMAKSNAYNV